MKVFIRQAAPASIHELGGREVRAAVRAHRHNKRATVICLKDANSNSELNSLDPMTCARIENAVCIHGPVFGA